MTRDRILKAATEPLARRYTTIPNIFDSILRATYFTDKLQQATQIKLADLAEEFFVENIDTRLWLADDLLAKVDRATMAHSLEARVPYLDQDLYSWCARLDPEHKVGRGVAKTLIKQLAEQYLPREIIYRPKQGFTMPLDRWIAGELRQDVTMSLGPSGLQRRGLIRQAAIEKMLAELPSGRTNHATRLWALLVLERWLSRYEPAFSL